MSQMNRQCQLAQRPVGLPGDEIWRFVEEPVQQPAEGQVLLRVLYASIDPAMRGWINDVRSYIPPVAIGEVMRAGAVSRVEASNHPDFSGGRSRGGHAGYSAVCAVRWQGSAENRSQPGTFAQVPGGAGHAGHDRVLWVAGCW